MVSFPPAKYRKRRKPKPAAVAAVPAAPVLVAASFDGAMAYLTFDRAVDISAMVPYQITVYDGPGGLEWGATPTVTQISPVLIEIAMIDLYAFTGEGVTMTATDATGIVAVDGGEAWAGVADVALPFN